MCACMCVCVVVVVVVVGAFSVREIVAHPYEVKSDSFYFAGSKLIMHNKAEYRYFDNGGAGTRTWWSQASESGPSVMLILGAQV